MFETNAAAQKIGGLLIQRDQRADGGKRQVRLTRNNVLISRRLSGISMMISVPLAAYRGVALSVEAASAGGAAYRLSLAHSDPDLDIVLAETQDSSAAAADWKYWASYLDLPRLAQEDGEARSVEGATRPQAPVRRRNASVVQRRPRFLARRKRGELARTETVFSGEREIICYE